MPTGGVTTTLPVPPLAQQPKVITTPPPPPTIVQGAPTTMMGQQARTTTLQAPPPPTTQQGFPVSQPIMGQPQQLLNGQFMQSRNTISKNQAVMAQQFNIPDSAKVQYQYSTKTVRNLSPG